MSLDVKAITERISQCNIYSLGKEERHEIGAVKAKLVSGKYAKSRKV